MSRDLRHRRQCGLAAVLLLLSLFSASSYLLLQQAAQTSTAGLSQDWHYRAQRLYKARQALLDYSVAYADNYRSSGAGPGHLPCPDHSPVADGNEANDGPDPPCSGSGTNVGRFPRMTYSRDLYSLKQAGKRIEFYPELSLQDQQLWYAVSRSHINNPVNTVVNPLTRARLQVDAAADVAAVIIDPGPDLLPDNPQRPGDSAAAYLEGENADADPVYTRRRSPGSNDLLVYISAAEISLHAQRRVTGFVRRWIEEYRRRNCSAEADDCFPAAADHSGVCQAGRNSGYLALHAGNCSDSLAVDERLDDTDLAAHWFVRNGWPAFFRYRRSPHCIAPPADGCTLWVEHAADPAAVSWFSVEPAATDAEKNTTPQNTGKGMVDGG